MKAKASEMVQDDTGTIPTSLDVAKRFRAACRSGDARAVSDLIAAGYDVNARDEHGMAALHHAASMGARGCVRVLVGSGKCDHLAEDNQGRTPVLLAYEFSADLAVNEFLAKKYARAKFALAQRQSPSPTVP